MKYKRKRNPFSDDMTTGFSMYERVSTPSGRGKVVGEFQGYVIVELDQPVGGVRTHSLLPSQVKSLERSKNPVSSRTRAKHAALMAEHRYEDAAKVYKRAMKRTKNPTGFKKFIVEFITTDPEQVKRARSISERWKAHSVRKHADGVTATFPDKMDMQKAVEAANGWGIPTAHGEKKRKNPLTAGLGGTYIVTHANPRSTPSKNVKLRFSSRSEAWEGMRKLDAAGIDAGFPSLGAEQTGPNKGYYTVQVARKNATAARKVLSGGGARTNPGKIPVKSATFSKIPHASGWHTYRLVQVRPGSRGTDKSAIFFAPSNEAAQSYAPQVLFEGARAVRLERAA